MDNLESQTYEIFERDPIKYRQYQRVRRQVLNLQIPHVSMQTLLYQHQFGEFKDTSRYCIFLWLVISYTIFQTIYAWPL